ncbi:MAG: hypothetical protein GY755_12380 [Chloroflexi bacterium]|nr:hypothetical protein [Chloroflexota bacterium]
MPMKFLKNYLREIIVIVAVILLIFVMMDYNARLDKLNQLNEKVAYVRAEATAVFETQVALQTEIANATSEPVTEGEARNNGEIQPGDQRFVPIPADGAPLLDGTLPQAPTPRLMKWEVWAALFFGE